jgi:hypothetical protein
MYLLLKGIMKEIKDQQIRIRITESQMKSIVSYIIDNPDEFKNKSELVRKSLLEHISRKKNITSKVNNKSKN